MTEPDHESIAKQAHRRWEEQGRPEGRDREFWLEAEAELKSAPPEPVFPEDGPAPTNLDRALPPEERRRARAARHESNGAPPGPGVRPAEHFVAVLDRAHLNIYRVRNSGRAERPRFEPVEKFQLAAGKQHYTDRDSDQAGRFGARLGPSGASIDERLPMQNEHERRLATDLAARLGRFLQEHDNATWDYAAGPAMHRAVLDRLPSTVLERLDKALPKELVHQSPAELEAHFAP